jgi:long-chain acyl-CoA synthetase
MSSILGALCRWAETTPGKLAIQDERVSLVYASTALQVGKLGILLAQQDIKVVALLADNSCAWALWDLAAMQAGVTMVPLPGFFSDAQLRHILQDAGVDTVISDQPDRVSSLITDVATPETALNLTVAERAFQLHRLTPEGAARLPAGTAKITYTSGTTGAPKGVLLGADAMAQVAASLVEASGADATDRHLTLLPLSTLLENIAGVYAPILAGGMTMLYSQQRVGMRGASGVDATQMLDAMIESEATTAITLPQLLKVLTMACSNTGSVPQQLRYLAVGGAHVSSQLLKAAQDCGLPVFQGYGLSECASVVAVNRPGDDRPDSVGRPLSHTQVRISPDGEIQVGGSLCYGYLHNPATPNGYWSTGDIGHLDDDGFLHITGRKKDIFITAFGRNVSPEWVEAEFTAQPAIAQAAVFGEAQPFNVAVLVSAVRDSNTLMTAIEAANARLPDYGRISAWVIADQPFLPGNGLASANGSLRRKEIERLYAERIADCYANEIQPVMPNCASPIQTEMSMEIEL